MGEIMGETTGEVDGLYEKYRVFKEPDVENGDGHPVPLTAHEPGEYGKPPNYYAEEVVDFIFPLKPDTDHHARVALAAYAWSVAGEKPRLAEDLRQVLSEFENE